MKTIPLILIGLVISAGCGKDPTQQILGRWELSTKQIVVDFNANGNYTMSNSGPELIAPVDTIPQEMRSLHLMATEGSWSIVANRLVVPCFSPTSGIEMSSTILQLDSKNLVLQHADSLPVHFLRLPPAGAGDNNTRSVPGPKSSPP
jgi:hypothetical protein